MSFLALPLSRLSCRKSLGRRAQEHSVGLDGILLLRWRKTARCFDADRCPWFANQKRSMPGTYAVYMWHIMSYPITRAQGPADDGGQTGEKTAVLNNSDDLFPTVVGNGHCVFHQPTNAKRITASSGCSAGPSPPLFVTGERHQMLLFLDA